jgi:C1A family cysteine protease
MSNEQIHEVCGALISPPDIRDYRFAATASNLPDTFELTMPAVKNQGSVGSCVAHSIALVMEFYNKKQHKQDIQMSVGYIYGNRVSTDYRGSGMYTKDAIKDACVEGNVPYELFPFNEEVPSIFDMVEREKEELSPKALPFRLTSYIKVVSKDEIKTALYNGYPVVFSIKWYKDTKVKNGVLTTTKRETSGSHCMVIYGWDERGWKFQNSWGKSWGNGGRAILPYDFEIVQAYSVIDELVGDIDIKKPFKTESKFGKWLIGLVNKISAVVYRIKYKIKY